MRPPIIHCDDHLGVTRPGRALHGQWFKLAVGLCYLNYEWKCWLPLETGLVGFGLLLDFIILVNHKNCGRKGYKLLRHDFLVCKLDNCKFFE